MLLRPSALCVLRRALFMERCRTPRWKEFASGKVKGRGLPPSGSRLVQDARHKVPVAICFPLAQQVGDPRLNLALHLHRTRGFPKMSHCLRPLRESHLAGQHTPWSSSMCWAPVDCNTAQWTTWTGQDTDGCSKQRGERIGSHVSAHLLIQLLDALGVILVLLGRPDRPPKFVIEALRGLGHRQRGDEQLLLQVALAHAPAGRQGMNT